VPILTTKALIEELHRLIDSKKDNGAILQEVYDILKENNSKVETDWWNTLTEEQQQELDRAEKEIKDPNNLIGHKEAMETARQFIKKDKHSDKN
jgi:hypothetical protein